MDIPEALLYTKDHEWIKITKNIVTVGITDYAQSELGDIIFVELPSLDDKAIHGESLGTIEAVKTVADIYSPVNGNIFEINNKLDEKPELINKEPYENGWIVKIQTTTNIKNDLLNAQEYKRLLG